MWHDVETTRDLLNFTVVADTAAQLVRESGGHPLSIGISEVGHSETCRSSPCTPKVAPQAERDH